MTDLNKMVKRRTVGACPAVRRRLIVMLLPGDVLGFKEEGRRKIYMASINKVFTTVAKWNAEAEAAERKRNRKLKQGRS